MNHFGSLVKIGLNSITIYLNEQIISGHQAGPSCPFIFFITMSAKGNWVRIEIKADVYVGDITKIKEEVASLNQEETMTKAIREYMEKKHPGDLKEPVTEEGFLRVRRMVEVINKSLKRPKNVGQVWGPNGEFSNINSVESFDTWFESDHFKNLKIQQEIAPFDVTDLLTDFEVVVFEGDLVTLSKDFEGGVGVESLWSDQISRSTGYKSVEHELNDPRRGYKFGGKRWEGCTKRKNSSQSFKSSKSSKKRKKS